MNRQLTSYLAMPVAFLILTLGAGAVAAAQERPTLTSAGVEILFHEPLELWESSSLGAAAVVDGEDVAPATRRVSFSAFGDLFELLLQSNDRLVAGLPSARRAKLREKVKLYRGHIEGVVDSWVRLTQIGSRWSGLIWDGFEMYVIDSSDAVAAALGATSLSESAYPLVYRLSDTLPGEAHCALQTAATPVNQYAELVNELQTAFQALPAATSQLDIAVVADVEFAQQNSDPEAAVIAQMNVVDGIYSEQVGVHLNVVEIQPLASNGSLSSTDPLGLLISFGLYASSSSFNNPGLSHLFTGKNLDGSTIGIAYLSALCSARFGVGVSQVGSTGTLGALTVAHEIGHNFGAPHDNQSGSACSSTPNGFIMNPSLNGSDQFSQCSIDQMLPEVAAASCVVPLPSEPTADVRVSLPVNPVDADSGSVFDYLIEVQSVGTDTASNVAASISVPGALTLLEVNADAGSCSIGGNGLASCDFGSLPAGVTRTITLSLDAQSAGSFTGSAQASADNDSDSGNNSALITFNVNDGGSGGGDQACSAPYWRDHTANWVGYSAPGPSYSSVFGVSASFNKSLLDTMRQGGGGENALGRHAVAALLNASHPGVDFAFSVSQVVAMVQGAYASGDFNTPKDLLKTQNLNGNCPLGEGVPEPVADVSVSLPVNPVDADSGSVFDYLIEVQSVGTDTASNAAASISVPGALTLLEVNADAGSCFIGSNGQASCDFGSLPAGVTRTITLSLDAQSAGSFTGSAQASADNDSDSGNNSALITFNVNDGGSGGGDQACSAPYWRDHTANWVGYSAPGPSYSSVFGVSASFNKSLLDTMRQGGGGENALGRHAVAALLNASHPGVDFAFSVSQVVAMVQGAYASGDFNTPKDLLKTQNLNGNCPLGEGVPEPVADVSVSLPVNPVDADSGSVFDYLIEVQSVGTDTASNAAASISVPGALTLLEVNADAGSCFIGSNGQASCDFGSLPAGVTRTITLSLDAQSAGSFTGSAQASADNDSDSGNDNALITFNVNDGGSGGGDQACSAPYWRDHTANWVGYSAPGPSYSSVFGVSASFNKSLLDTMRQGGGGENALGRHAVAALLNASHPGVDFAFSVSQVVAMVQGAYASGDFNTPKDLLKIQNRNGNCPLN